MIFVLAEEWAYQINMIEEVNAGNMCPTKVRGTHFARLNFQSINNKFDLVKIQVKELGFHIFSFSESWLTSNVPDSLVGLEGYNVLRWDRKWFAKIGIDIKMGGVSDSILEMT